jgi:hypothetical protein
MDLYGGGPLRRGRLSFSLPAVAAAGPRLQVRARERGWTTRAPRLPDEGGPPLLGI